MTTCVHCGLETHPGERRRLNFFGDYAHLEGRCRDLLRGRIDEMAAALQLALPILEEVTDADIISCSRVHHPGATEEEHLASMEADDRTETARIIAARDAVADALK